MTMRIRLFIGFLILLISAQAQEEYLKGRDFWTTSFSAYSSFSPFTPVRPDTCVLYITGDTICSGYVENPNTGFNQSFSIVPGLVTVVKIPHEHIMSSFHSFSFADTTMPTGLHIVSNKNVLVYQMTNLNALNTNFNSTTNKIVVQKTPIWPTQLFNSYAHYYNTNSYTKPFGLIATADSTVVNVYENDIPILQRSLQKGDFQAVYLNNSTPYSEIKIETLDNSKLLPQLETPGALIELLNKEL